MKSILNIYGIYVVVFLLLPYLLLCSTISAIGKVIRKEPYISNYYFQVPVDRIGGQDFAC